MATLATVRTKIAEILQDPQFNSISVASVNAVINDAINYYKYRRYWFNEALAVLTCTTGNKTLSGIPSDSLMELTHGGISVLFGNIVYPLEKISTEAYDTRDIGGLGLPYCYTFRAGTYQLYYYPNTTYTINFRYLKNYTELVNESDTNDFLTYAERMIRANALARIYAEFKQDANMETYFTARADDEERNLLRRSNALSGSGSLVKDSVLLN